MAPLAGFDLRGILARNKLSRTSAADNFHVTGGRGC
jgi:hypothetical protein